MPLWPESAPTMPPPRELEVVDYTFEFLLDYGAFRRVPSAQDADVPSSIVDRIPRYQGSVGDCRGRTLKGYSPRQPAESERTYHNICEEHLSRCSPVCGHPRSQPSGALEAESERVLSSVQAENIEGRPRVHSLSDAESGGVGQGSAPGIVQPPASCGTRRVLSRVAKAGQTGSQLVGLGPGRRP